tara:strand:+ start:357 stop:710 length:354 start_codon:yes stop_codon:yes gene_type:complete
MEKRNLYIVVALVLVVGLALSFFNFTGQSTLGIDKGDCLDSDGGNDPEVPGIASYENRDDEYKDECLVTTSGQKKFLKEKFCLQKIETKRYVCDTGCKEDANGVGYCEEGQARLEID